jgi:hypothetical protein
MAEISNYLENAIINATLRNTSYSSPSTVYIGLYTSNPTDANTGTEVSGGSYARKSVTFAAPSDGVAASNSDVIFDTATANWGTITHIGILDALTSGNLLYHTQLDTSKVIDTNDIFRINSGALTVTIA